MGDSKAPKGQVLAIAGCTNSGKTTVAKAMADMIIDKNATVEIIHQDDFFFEKEKVNKILRDGGPEFYYDYDSAEALDGEGMINSVLEASKRSDFVIIEGNMLTEFPELLDLCDFSVFLTLDQNTCRRRRDLRVYDPPDDVGYFDNVAWPSYQAHLKSALALARNNRRIAFVDVSCDNDDVDKGVTMSLIDSFSEDVLRITEEKLDVEKICRMVNSDSCGATSVFIGTTRDTFNGRRVTRLEYESYDEMAYKELRRLCQRVRDQFKSLERIVIVHRIGVVPVGEASVIIATASPHRADAIGATEKAINELKRTVPIWKKEMYADGGCSWKENGEFEQLKNRAENGCGCGKKNGIETPRPSSDQKLFSLLQLMHQLRS